MEPRKKLSLNDVCYLLIHKPLAIVRLEHSEYNKRIICKAINAIAENPRGGEIFQVLQEFLRYSAPKYQLTPDQNGARLFLLRQTEHVIARRRRVARPQGLLGGLSKAFGFA